jgi:hypothetical protein
MRKRKMTKMGPKPIGIEEAANRLILALDAARERQRNPRPGLMRADAGVRPIVRPSHMGWVGNHNSRRFGPIQFESLSEHDFLNRADCETIYSIVVRQPVVVAWTDAQGVVRRHIPDFGAVRDGLPEIVEVKSQSHAQRTDIAARTNILRAGFLTHGIGYEVVCEDWFREEPACGNARLLALGRPYEPTEGELAAVETCLAECGPLDAWQIAETLGCEPQFAYSVYALCLDGHLKLVNPNASIRDDGRFTLA